MDKCEHNQKIVKFCATESCAWKESAGCQICIKKYHNHIAHSIFLEQKDIENLLKKYKTEAFTKPKVKFLQESIHNYFSNFKVQLISYIDELDKKIRTDLYYPILIQQGTINIYKKLKKRQYRKMNQKQFRSFYDNASKLTFQQISNEERRIYRQLSLKYSKMFNQISSVFNNLETSLKNIETNLSFKIDTNYTQKVQFFFSEVNKQFNKLESDEEATTKRTKKGSQSYKNSDISTMSKPHTINQKEQIKFIINQPNNIFTPNQSAIKKQDDSTIINTKKQDQLSQMKRKLLFMMDQDQKNKYMSPFQTKVQEIRAKSKQKGTQQREKSNSKINNQNIRPGSNHKNNYLEVPNNDIYTPIQKKLSNPDENKSLSGNSSLSINLGDSMFKGQTPKQQFNQKHNQLPSQNSQMESESDSPPINKHRAIVIPIRGEFKIDSNENSPILKKKRENQNFNLLKVEQVVNQEMQSSKKITLNEEEEKSVAILKESLKRKAEEAIPILQRCLEIAPNNLSAAEYLSFLLLETGKPVQCLKVCNNILQLLEGEVIYDINSLHIHNNKAVSLIQLGRYSESIPLLQKCLQVKQMDIFYKNLGDAYYLIGIYQKSLYNYRKSIALNNRNSQQFYNLAVCLFAQQNYQQALINIQTALKLQSQRQDYIQLAQQIRERI